jgi:F420-non-reducing hydrogenase small subunit
MNKPRLAHVVLGGCEGCYVSLLDAHEGLVELAESVDLVYSPLTDSKEMDFADVVLVEGAITTEHDIAVLKEARNKATTLVAVGSCAALGGIGGLRNLYTADEMLEAIYGDDKPVGDGLPKVTASVQPASDIVEVDISVPGCAPKTETLLEALHAALAGESWEMPRRNMCDECEREKDALLEHSSDFVSDMVYAPMELEHIDQKRCFLEQGVLCMGPMTREGCGARCTAANVPCRGCQGPSRPDYEQGGKTVDALAAILPAGAIMIMDDLIGTGYRFSMPASVFPTIVEEGGCDDE